jgi:hypothetical protein
VHAYFSQKMLARCGNSFHQKSRANWENEKKNLKKREKTEQRKNSGNFPQKAEDVATLVISFLFLHD